MIGYNGIAVSRNDAIDPMTSKVDLNASIGTLVTVRVASIPPGIGATASLFDVNDAPIANPVTSDDNGNYFFKVDSGTYDIISKEGTGDEFIEPSETIGATAELINDLSQAYNFTFVNSMTSSAIAFPAGKRLKTDYHNSVSMAGGAEYIVRAGASPEPVGSPDLNGAFYAELQGKADWMTPEVFGSDGTAAVDSIVIPKYMAACRKQLWKSGKTYILDADIAGNSRAFEVFSDTEMIGYGAVIDLIGTQNNGFYMGFDNGSLFRIRIAGFRFINSNVIDATNAILLEGFANYLIVEDCVSVGIGQYFLGMGGVNSGFNHCTVRNNKALNTNPNGGNFFSLPFEFFPKVASKDLQFYGNYGEQAGGGGCFKIHSLTDADIYDNVFVRTTNVPGSNSQSVMLGGRVGEETHNIRFHHNRIEDANGSLGALFLGNGSDKTFVDNNKIEGVGSTIWIGTGLADSEITSNVVDNIYSLGASSVLTNLIIEGNTLFSIDFAGPPSGNLPDQINGLFVKTNKITGSVRFQVTTSSSKLRVLRNDFENVTAKSIFACDDIEFKYNNIILDDSWAAGTQFADVTSLAGNYKQMNNTWDMKGLTQQTVWLNGPAGAQVVGETVEDPTVRLVLDNGTSSELFDNRLKISGGGWTLV